MFSNVREGANGNSAFFVVVIHREDGNALFVES